MADSGTPSLLDKLTKCVVKRRLVFSYTQRSNVTVSLEFNKTPYCYLSPARGAVVIKRPLLITVLYWRRRSHKGYYGPCSGFAKVEKGPLIPYLSDSRNGIVSELWYSAEHKWRHSVCSK
jgi:hypothetical protein